VRGLTSNRLVKMRCYIGVGSNLGDRRMNIETAIQNLRRTEGIKMNRVSQIYETEPVGGLPQPRYLNGAVEIETDLDPKQLLVAIQNIENSLGRERTIKNGPRTIDLDILTYGDRKIDEPDLKVPHPKMHKREFVLRPLRDLML